MIGGVASTFPGEARMTGAPPRVIMDAIIFLAICLTALGCLVHAIRKKRTEARRVELPIWRQVAIALGFLAVATQAAVFFSFWIWPSIGRDYVSFGQWARWVLPPFIVAVPCALAGKAHLAGGFFHLPFFCS